jgi:hypothetical protein
METTKISLRYSITREFQFAEVLAGRPIAISGEREVEVPLKEAIERGAIWIDSKGHLVRVSDPTPTMVTDEDGCTVAYDHVPSDAELLSDWRAVLELRRAKEAARKEHAERERAERAERDTEVLRAFIEGHGEYRSARRYGLSELHLYGNPDRTGACRSIFNTDIDRDLFDAAVRHGEEIEAERQARISAEAEARAEERDAWIREHGSERLRAALDTDMIGACEASYRAERLAHDFPGWTDSMPGSEGAASEPTLAELLAFADARKSVPDCVMVSVDVDDDRIHVAKVAELPGIGDGPFWRVLS